MNLGELKTQLASTFLLWFLVAKNGWSSDPPLLRFERTQPHMGTLARIVVYAPDSSQASEAFRAAFGRIEALNEAFSDYRPDSELNRLCRHAGGSPIVVSTDLLRVLSDSQALAEESEGAFDVTAGPLIQLWRRARRQHELPAPERLVEALKLSGYRWLKLDSKQSTVQLMKAGMRLDLGGIAKGYAADEALKLLEQRGIQRALVALGGDIAVSDAPPGKKGWTIDIDPAGFSALLKPEPLTLRHAAISTSGDVEQFTEISATRYSHIIDPRTGNALVGRSRVSVVAKTGTKADGLATAVSVLGPDRGLKLIDSTSGAAALIVLETDQGVKSFRSKRWRQ
jgi:FAD:protein FMN transferase